MAVQEQVDIRTRKPLYKQLYFWVLVGITLGILLGHFFPTVAVQFEPLGTSFVNLIKMVIAPVIFCTVVVGIASMEDMKKVGRVGVKALAYFEVVSTIALILGLVAVNVFKPGAGVNAAPGGIQVNETVKGYIGTAQEQHWYDFIFHIFPDSVVGAFAENNVLQVLFFSVVFAFALHLSREHSRPVLQFIEQLSHAFFKVIRIVMYAAPVGAFGAMAFTIGKYGIDTLTSLGKLMALFYGTSIFFVLVVLGVIARLNGVNIFKLLRYIKEELLIVLGTSSSESVLPALMRKLEHLGCSKPVVGLTVPAGYSFNLDGTSIYLTLAAIYVAQAQNVRLSIGQQLGIVGVLLLTSKGAAGVTGSGFIVLAATLSAVGTIPVAGIMLIFGIDKFMSEGRALVNATGNSVASIVVARWEGEFDADRARRVLDEKAVDEFDILTEEEDEEFRREAAPPAGVGTGAGPQPASS